MTRTGISAAVLVFLPWLGGHGLAQTAPGGVYLGGGTPATKTCVQVQVGGEKASPYSCLNQQMQRQAEAAGGSAAPAIPLGANAPSNAVGTFNEAGVKEQYGQNFGKSVIPYRPPPPVFANQIP